MVTASATLFARTLVSVTQSVSQGVSINSVLNIQCGQPAKTDTCRLCLEVFRERAEVVSTTGVVDFDPSICDFACTCAVEDVEMRSLVTCDLSTSMLSSIGQETIQRAMLTNIRHMTTTRELPIVAVPDMSTLATKYAAELHALCQSESFQGIVSAINNNQSVTLKGAGKIAGASFEQTTHVIENILMTSQVMSDLILEAQSQMVTMSSQLVLSASDTIVEWVVRIVVYLVILLLCIFSVWSTISVVKTTLRV